MVIKPEQIKSAILDELIHPFKNLFSESYIYGLLEKISDNFIQSVLTGEYLNLLSLSTVKIYQISFIEQVRRFVRICLNRTIPEEDYGRLQYNYT